MLHRLLTDFLSCSGGRWKIYSLSPIANEALESINEIQEYLPINKRAYDTPFQHVILKKCLQRLPSYLEQRAGVCFSSSERNAERDTINQSIHRAKTDGHLHFSLIKKKNGNVYF